MKFLNESDLKNLISDEEKRNYVLNRKRIFDFYLRRGKITIAQYDRLLSNAMSSFESPIDDGKSRYLFNKNLCVNLDKHVKCNPIDEASYEQNSTLGNIPDEIDINELLARMYYAYNMGMAVENIANQMKGILRNREEKEREMSRIKNEIETLIGKIPENRLNARVYPFLNTFFFNKTSIRGYERYWPDDSYLAPIKNIKIPLICDNLIEIEAFLKWCCYDIDNDCAAVLTCLDASKRRLLKIRAAGTTLQNVGIEQHVTRSRIQQKEAAIIREFQSHERNYQIVEKVFLEANSVEFLTEEEFKSYIHYQADLITYILKKSNGTRYLFDDRVKVFYDKKSNLIKRVEDYILRLPDTIKEKRLQYYLRKGEMNGLPAELIHRMIEYAYTLKNNGDYLLARISVIKAKKNRKN